MSRARAGEGVPSAAQVAVAIVAAARLFGVAPDRVFEGARKVRLVAAAGLAARLGCRRNVLARMLKLCPPELSPSMLARSGVTAEQLLVVADALAAHGLCDGDDARSRFLSPWEREGRAAAARERPQPAAAPACERRSRKADGDGEPAGGARAVAGDADAAPDSAGGADAGSDVSATQVRVEPARPREIRAGGVGGGADEGIASGGPSRPAGCGSPVAARSAFRLRPVTARVARWAGDFLDARWSLDEVAELFDVHPDALVDALERGVAA